MAIVADAGALIALDRGDRAVAARIDAAQRRGVQVVTSSACVAQVWRDGGGRQSRLARLLKGIDERPLDPVTSRNVGELCARAGTSDVVDAHVASLAKAGDVVLMSDDRDLTALLAAARVRALVIHC